MVGMVVMKMRKKDDVDLFRFDICLFLQLNHRLLVWGDSRFHLFVPFDHMLWRCRTGVNHYFLTVRLNVITAILSNHLLSYPHPESVETLVDGGSSQIESKNLNIFHHATLLSLVLLSRTWKKGGRAT